MLAQTHDLFDDTGPAEQVRAFRAAFEQWLAHQRTSASRKITLASSVRSYTVIWQAFAQWCLSQSPVVSLDSITEADLGSFINSRLEPKSVARSKPSRLKEAGKFTPRHAWRLLTLIDSVLEFRARAVPSSTPNGSAAALLRSREDWLHANAHRRDTLPDYLEPTEARVLVNYLCAGLPRSGRRGADITWQELRNRSAVTTRACQARCTCPRMATARSAKRRSSSGRGVCWPAGCRCARSRGSQASSCFPRRARANRGAR
ncbi:MAG: hypothetical protein MUF54_25985 [Polyangiaceae bacterium]|nr:hypothetical protein [Polyangiaceae bacterium]